MLGFFKNTFSKIYSQITTRLEAVFSREQYDESAVKELETILISADTGTKTTKYIIESVKKRWQECPEIPLKTHLEDVLITILESTNISKHDAQVYLLVGINGCGKTTFAAKLAYYYSLRGKKVLLVGADTFRAAAYEQLNKWALSLSIPLVAGVAGQDPSAVLFSGSEQFIRGGYDILIIDTAGRLHTKVNLMNELAKMKRVLAKQLPCTTPTVLLTIDSMLGQSSFEQAQLFAECTPLSGIVLTKMDGTGKGGIVFSIAYELHIPIVYITHGEKLEHLQPFVVKDYVHDLLAV